VDLCFCLDLISKIYRNVNEEKSSVLMASSVGRKVVTFFYRCNDFLLFSGRWHQYRMYQNDHDLYLISPRMEGIDMLVYLQRIKENTAIIFTNPYIAYSEKTFLIRYFNRFMNNDKGCFPFAIFV